MLIFPDLRYHYSQDTCSRVSNYSSQVFRQSIKLIQKSENYSKDVNAAGLCFLLSSHWKSWILHLQSRNHRDLTPLMWSSSLKWFQELGWLFHLVQYRLDADTLVVFLLLRLRDTRIIWWFHLRKYFHFSLSRESLCALHPLQTAIRVLKHHHRWCHCDGFADFLRNLIHLIQNKFALNFNRTYALLLCVYVWRKLLGLSRNK